MNKNKLGFTLIELLVVVLIIGILSAIALPQYQKAVEKTRIAEAKILLSSLSNAQDIYILETGDTDGGTYDFEQLNISLSGTHTKVNGISHIKTKDWDIHMDECAPCSSNSFGCVLYADRINNDYSIVLAGSSYNMCLPSKTFYCLDNTNHESCKKVGAVYKEGGEWDYIFP